MASCWILGVPPQISLKQHGRRTWVSFYQEILGFPYWNCFFFFIGSWSLCVNHCLIQFKVVHRAQISKASPYRVKCKHVEAPLIHMYWCCSSLNKYWSKDFYTLSWVLNIKLEPNILIALFGIMEGEKKLTIAKQRTLYFASLLARRAILLRWKDDLEDIMSVLKLEKVRYSF